MNRPTLLFYCQHSLGMGHLVRSMNLVRSLRECFHVVFLNGGRLPATLDVPDGIDLINLPPLGMNLDSTLVSQTDGQTLDAARQSRKKLILQTLQTVKPRVVLIELFPFGRKKFAFELLPLLKTARRSLFPPQVYCSLRDIMVGGRKDQLRHDNRAAWLINRYFDGVLIHADSAFAHLEESFRPELPLRKPVHYTGFIAPELTAEANGLRKPWVVVSAGGGIVGGGLFRTAVAAQTRVHAESGLEMQLVAGPFFAETEWRALQKAAAGVPGLILHRELPGLVDVFAKAAVSVSQCGYNTAMDIVTSQVPALVVPFSEGNKDEQLNRARRMEQMGLVRVLEPGELTSERLSRAILALREFRPCTEALALDGATRCTKLLKTMAVRTRTARTTATDPQADSTVVCA